MEENANKFWYLRLDNKKQLFCSLKQAILSNFIKKYLRHKGGFLSYGQYFVKYKILCSEW